MTVPSPTNPGIIARSCMYVCARCRTQVGRCLLYAATPPVHCGVPAVPFAPSDAVRRARWLREQAPPVPAVEPMPTRSTMFVCTTCHRPMGHHVMGTEVIHQGCGGTGRPLHATHHRQSP